MSLYLKSDTVLKSLCSRSVMSHILELHSNCHLTLGRSVGVVGRLAPTFLAVSMDVPRGRSDQLFSLEDCWISCKGDNVPSYVFKLCYVFLCLFKNTMREECGQMQGSSSESI